MKTKINFYLLICFAVFINGCTTKENAVFSTENASIRPPTMTASALPVIPTKSEPTLTSLPTLTMDELWSQWEHIAIEIPPENLALGEGPSGVYWILGTDTITRLVSKTNNYDIYKFHDLIGCDKCQDVVNGTLVVSSKGDAWVGLTNGVLVIQGDGIWRYIPLEDISPLKSLKDESNDHYWSALRVLLEDKHGSVWISYANTLCFLDVLPWKCKTFDDLNETSTIAGITSTTADHIVSAVSGHDEQIWFGTQHGKLILYDEGVFSSMEDLRTSSNKLLNAGDMAYDNKNDVLWIINTEPPHCDAEGNDDATGVARKDSNGNWVTFERKFFYSNLRRRMLLSITDDCG